MKRFNISKSDFRFNGIRMPIGCVYGELITHSGTRIMNDGNGNVAIKRNAYEHRIVYYCDDFNPVVVNGHLHYYIHEWVISDRNHERWNHSVCTAQSPKYYELAEALSRFLEKYNIASQTRCDSCVVGSPVLSEPREMIYTGYPKMR